MVEFVFLLGGFRPLAETAAIVSYCNFCVLTELVYPPVYRLGNRVRTGIFGMLEDIVLLFNSLKIVISQRHSQYLKYSTLFPQQIRR